MLTIIRTDNSDPGYNELVKMLDADLAIKDGDEHAFYAQFNSSGLIKHILVAYDAGLATGCGAIKEFSPGVMEVKRMFTLPGHRGKGIASRILNDLEKWAAELHYKKCILETGKKQKEAIALYLKNGYTIIPNYGQYAGVANSICFEKELHVDKVN
jgi:GNAT superfamily N-acetyltransferase